MKPWLGAFGAALLLTTLSTPADAKLKVFACLPEWVSLVTEIGGDQVDVTLGTPVTEDPDTLRPTPSLIVALQEADLLVCTGAGLSVGLDPMLAQAQNPKLAPDQPGYFMARDYVELMQETWEYEQDNVEHRHAEGNNHIQTDPYNVIKVAAALGKRMIAIDPANETAYAAATKAFIDRLSALAKALEAKAAALKGVTVAATHVHSSYMLRWLGMTSAVSIEPAPGIPPGPQHLAQIIEDVPVKNIRFVIYGNFEDPGNAQFIGERANIPVVMMPFSVGGSGQAEDLFGLYEDSVDRLLDGLNGIDRPQS